MGFSCYLPLWDFLIFGVIGRKIENKPIISRIIIFLDMVSVAMISLINKSMVIIIFSAVSLFIIGYIGSQFMYKLSINYVSNKWSGTCIGVAMAVSIIMQYLIQNNISSRNVLFISFEVLLFILFILDFVTDVVKENVAIEIKPNNNMDLSIEKENVIFSKKTIY